MEVNNPLYRNQGIHVIASIFTVEKGIARILLIKRKNNPYQNMWALVGGAVYNNESVDEAIKREVAEKTGIKKIDLSLCNVFGKVNRSPVMRMVAISYIGVIDSEKVAVLSETLKTSNADWVPIDRIPVLAYDHNEIFEDALIHLKDSILNTDILKSLFPNGFTLPELQKTCESIMEEKFDRRNFRRKLLNSELIIDTKREVKFEGTKPAKLYQFKKK